MLVLKQNYHRIYFDYQVALHRGKDFASESKIEPSQMGVYIHCYLHPLLERMRRNGELTPKR